MTTYTTNKNLYKWDATDTKQSTIQEMSTTMDIIDSELVKVDKIGDVTSLKTSSKSDLVGAINELDNDIGDLSNLLTTDKTSVVNAINEAIEDKSAANLVGDLTKLQTTDKTDLVSAINDNTSQLADISTNQIPNTPGNKYRFLSNLLNSAVPVSTLTSQCLLRKLRTDYTEFELFTPMTPDGKTFAHWYFTNRLNTGNTGCVRAFYVEIADLSKSTVIASLAYNDPNRIGTWYATPSANVRNNTGINQSSAIGDSVTYSASNMTKVQFRYYGGTNSGIVNIVIKDSTGTEIPSANYSIPFDGTNHYVDMFDGTGTLYYKELASNLPKGTYTIKITASSTKNSLSTDYRIYDGGLTEFDQNTAGVLGTDSFAVYPNSQVIGNGNLEYAVQVRKTTSTNVNDLQFVTGTHGNETNPANFVVTLDGVTIDYAGGAQNAQWLFDTMEVSFTTQVGFSTDANTHWANMSYSFIIDQGGYTATVSRTTILDVLMGIEYSVMLMSPSTNNSISSYVGGGFKKMAIDGDINYTLNKQDDSEINLPSSRGCVIYNSQYATSVDCLNAQTQWIEGSINNGREGVLQDRSDNHIKYYLIRRDNKNSGGDLLKSGDSATTTMHFRVIKSKGLSSLLGA